MKKSLSDEQVKGLPKEIATVINRLSETNKIIANGFAIRKPRQYVKFADVIQQFNDGQGQFALSQVSGLSYPDVRQKYEKFAKKIGLGKIDLSGIPVAASGVADLAFLQFYFGLDYEFLKKLIHEHFKAVWEWDSGWNGKINLPEVISKERVILEERPLDVPHPLWHSGQAEAPEYCGAIRMCGQTAVKFAAMSLKFMTPAEYLEFALFKIIMDDTLIDKTVLTLCPRSRWSDGKVPHFGSYDGKFNVNWAHPGSALGHLRVRPVSL